MDNQDAASRTPAAQTIEPTGPDIPLADHPTVDQMGEWSFPASDPPATWTWDPVVRPDSR